MSHGASAPAHGTGGHGNTVIMTIAVIAIIYVILGLFLYVDCAYLHLMSPCLLNSLQSIYPFISCVCY